MRRGFRQRKKRNFKINGVKKRKHHCGAKTDLTGDPNQDIVVVAPRWLIRKELISSARRDARNAGDSRYDRLKAVDDANLKAAGKCLPGAK